MHPRLPHTWRVDAPTSTSPLLGSQTYATTLVDGMLGTALRASCMSGKHVTRSTTSAAL